MGGHYGYYSPTPRLVIVDLETTGLDKGAHIMQMAAKCGRSVFNAYLLPWRPIHPMAAKITGFQRSGRNLFVRGVRKHTLTTWEAAQQFVNFLHSVGGNVVLVAHNAFNFDAFHLLRLVWTAGLWDELCDVCVGFADTLPLLRARYAYRYNHGLAKMIMDFLPEEYFPLHNAVGDVRALDRLIEVTGLTDAMIANSAKDLHDLFSVCSDDSLMLSY